MNQSDTNPLATALAALMTGHNANPNTSLRIPLVDSNGNLQPGPTLAELASVLGGVPTKLLGKEDDLNSIRTHGIIYSSVNTDSPMNCPQISNFNNNIYLVLKQSPSNRYIQFAFSLNARILAFRIYNGTIWCDWEEINSTTIS
jgi:hypothetical protein